MLKEYIKLIRMLQWIKNIFVFVPLIFSKHLFQSDYLFQTFKGFVAFSLISSIVYIINDILDKESDKKHPVKKFRPIASGKISVNKALLTGFILALFLLAILLMLPSSFGLITLAYFLLNLAYSTKLKKIVLLDIFSIAAGFMLRVTAGGYVIDVNISSWLILTTMFLSLFLAVLKRRSELELADGEKKNSARVVLGDYSFPFLDQITTVASAGVVICYALYTVDARTINSFRTENLIYTTPFILLGVFRYMFLVLRDRKGEYTTEIVLKDGFMITNALLYAVLLVSILYFKF